MKSIINYFAGRHLLANLITILIILIGVRSLMTIKRDMFPNVDMDQLVITTRYPGASPEDVELNVTNKIEDELKGIDGIDEMTSYSMENISVITIFLDPDASDKDKTKQDIRDGVGRVSDFPMEVTESPGIFEVKSENFEVIWVGLTGDIPYNELRDYARSFEKKMKLLPGVSRVAKTGYRAREVKVEISQDALEEYQIPMQEVVSAIQFRNIRATGGSFESYTSDKNIVALAQFQTPEEVGDVIIRSTFNGPSVTVNDLGTIRDDFEPEKTRFRMNGKEVIAFQVFKNNSADIIRVVNEIKNFVAEEQEMLPDNVEIVYSSDLSRFVRARLNVLATNGALGLVLVVIVLFIFLNLRTAFWVAMGIPLSLLVVMVLSPLFGVYLDAISMMGMILVIGLIVDDAIVIAENIAYRRDVLGENPLTAAVEGTSRVLRPVFATIITTMMAFTPFFFMEGDLGKFIYPIPLIIILALGVSFLEGILILPCHVTGGGKQKEKGTRSRVWFDSLRSHFQQFTVRVLRLRYLVLLFFLAALIGTGYYAKNHMKFVLFPGEAAEQFYVTLELPTGASLDATTDKVLEIEALILGLPENEFESMMASVGSLGHMNNPGESENWAFIYVTLTPHNQRERTAEQIIEELREQSKSVEGIDILRYVVEGGGPPVGRPVTLRVTGSNNDIRAALADSVETFMASHESIIDITRDDKLGKEQVEIKIDYVRLSQLGLTVADVAQAVRLAYDGMLVTSVRYDEEDVGFRVQLEPETRQKPDFLKNLAIPNRQGRLIGLHEVATFDVGPGPSSFFHFDGERSVTISADIAEGSDITPLEAVEMIVGNFDLSQDWPGMQIMVAGEAEETQKSMVSLGQALMMAGVGIYIVLILLFNSVFQPLLVMFAIPFGMIGVIGAFALHGTAFGFLAVMGVIGMMGVVVNDSLILVNFINVHRREFPDKKFIRIVAEGTAGRFRPILLTSITTVSGLMPTAYGIGGYDPFVADMALALGYGILFATPLTLILLPCLYTIQHDFGNLVRKIPGMGHFKFIPQYEGVHD